LLAVVYVNWSVLAGQTLGQWVLNSLDF